ncbi:probable cytochrome P450 6d5 [Contarinia nasturtii]|uniref:probable cytochrome P450 6d5 n=1 Tax=Contarinia nasturtii TaxID=265458 RepID=UPI0012D464F3|nr:probable cytochrome P450 6d5 [Contarinia nasturtii]
MALLTRNWTIDVLTVLIVAFALVYFLVKRTYSYWERNGFKTLAGSNLIFGHFQGIIFRKEFVGSLVKRLYDSTSEPFIGIYSILRPILLIRDPELIRMILIKDFEHFTDRGVYCNEEKDPLSGHLFALPGKKWKNLRTKLTPAFTSGKMKAMFSTLLNCGSELENHLNNLVDNGKVLNAREISSCFTTNVTASVGFGLEIDAIKNPDNEFRVCGREIFSSNLINVIRQLLFFNSPNIMQTIGMKTAQPSVEKFIRSVATQNVEYREKHNVSRKDIFQLLIQLRNTGSVNESDDKWDVVKANENQKKFTLDEISAQTFLFFIAGFETSSTTLSFCLYELAKNLEIQCRVHDEIDVAVQKHVGQLTYETLAELKYLDTCIDETLRKYPSLSLLPRSCVKDYRIPGTNKVIKKGMQVFISVLGLGMDAKYYAEPDKFIPDRFNEENSVGKNLINRPYLPFGDGPRNCIGLKLGLLQTKVGLVMMLQKFRFELSDHHKNTDMKFDPKFFFMAPLDGIHLKVFKR